MGELEQILSGGPAAEDMDGLGMAIRLMISGLLGLVIAFLYRISRTVSVRSEGERNPGLFPTLVLLAMLITLVTIAVGSNVAVAFTLVGTLAIVRFRTTVSDVRDTAFVIFSVAVGIAVGQNLQVAFAGTLVIGTAILLLRAAGTLSEAGSAVGDVVLRIDVAPPGADPALYETVMSRFGVTGTIRSTRVDRDRGRLRITLSVSGLSREQAPQLVTALLEQPEIVDAAVDFGLEPPQ